MKWTTTIWQQLRRPSSNQLRSAVWFIDSQQFGAELGPSGRGGRRWRGRRLNLHSRQLKSKREVLTNRQRWHTAYTIIIVQLYHSKWDFICRSSTSGPIGSYFLLCFRITWKHSKIGFLCKSRPPCRAREKKGCYWCFCGDECCECCARFYGGQKWITPCRYLGILWKEPQNEMAGLLVLHCQLRILKASSYLRIFRMFHSAMEDSNGPGSGLDANELAAAILEAKKWTLSTLCSTVPSSHFWSSKCETGPSTTCFLHTGKAELEGDDETLERLRAEQARRDARGEHARETGVRSGVGATWTDLTQDPRNLTHPMRRIPRDTKIIYTWKNIYIYIYIWKIHPISSNQI